MIRVLVADDQNAVRAGQETRVSFDFTTSVAAR